MHVQQFTRQFLEVKACEKVQQHSLTADVLCHCNIAVGREIFVPLFPGNLQLYIVGVSRLCAFLGIFVCIFFTMYGVETVKCKWHIQRWSFCLTKTWVAIVGPQLVVLKFPPTDYSTENCLLVWLYLMKCLLPDVTELV